MVTNIVTHDIVADGWAGVSKLHPNQAYAKSIQKQSYRVTCLQLKTWLPRGEGELDFLGKPPPIEGW